MLLFDFDGTQFDTFASGPRGLGVREASYLAINDVLGESAALNYASRPELHNFAPTELVNLCRENGYREEIRKQAYNFYSSNKDSLSGLVPGGKGTALTWRQGENTGVISEMLVRQKLRYLLDQVGEKTTNGDLWPVPTRGFEDFWKNLISIQESIPGAFKVTTGIVSSGHETFIRKVFDKRQLKQPDIIVTEDDVRGRKNPPLDNPREAIRRYKPGLLPIALGHREWLREQEMTGNNFSVSGAAQSRDRIIYFGDDLKKDGEMAFASRIFFGHYKYDAQSSLNSQSSHITFNDWGEIGKLLKTRSGLLREGKSIGEVFSQDSLRYIEGNNIKAVEKRTPLSRKEMLY